MITPEAPSGRGRSRGWLLLSLAVLAVLTSGCEGVREVLSAIGESAKVLGDAGVEAIESRGRGVTVDGTTVTFGDNSKPDPAPQPLVTVDLKEQTGSYDVPGGNYRQLASNISSASKRAAAAKGASENEIAWTLFQVARKVKMSCDSSRRALEETWVTHCAASVSVDATIEIILPRATTALSADDQRRWDRLVRRIRVHEEGHAQIDRRTVEELRAVLSQPGLLTEDAAATTAEQAQQTAIDILDERVSNTVDAKLAEDRAAQEEYHNRVGTTILIDR